MSFFSFLLWRFEREPFMICLSRDTLHMVWTYIKNGTEKRFFLLFNAFPKIWGPLSQKSFIPFDMASDLRQRNEKKRKSIIVLPNLEMYTRRWSINMSRKSLQLQRNQYYCKFITSNALWYFMSFWGDI